MAGGSSHNEFRFFLSCDISLPLAFRVLHAEHILSAEKKVPELFVECKLYIDGLPFGLPVKTRLESSGPTYCWNEHHTLSTKYRDLTSLSQLAFTVWDVSSGEDADIVGGATIFLFNSKRHLKTGRQKLRLWPKREADGRVPTTTPGKVPKNERGEIERMERLVNKYERGQIQHVDWLDRLAFSAMEKAKEKECEKKINFYPSLVVELCSFEHRVVFQESGANFYAPTPVSLSNELVTVWDPELGRTNPSEHKQLKLARSLTRGIVDRDLKPSSNERKLLQTIIKFPPTRALEVDEKQLVWKFRFSLMSEKKALTKFVRSVDWSDNQEAKQAIELIGKWETIDVADALELLSPDFESDESVGREDGDEDGFRLWQSLFRQTELTAQLCTIMKDVIQTVSLMDRLLKLENLDLHLTPYRVLATGQDEGMLEFVPSSSLAQILSEHRGITSYLQKFHPDEDGPFGITVQCLETFIKSCAGYSVITYILGVGDRHLDNLLLTDDGRLFHVDFAFILGRDPKPFPPPMKLCKEMVEAMGGAERFKSYCCEAYNILRKSSSLILNLFKLMERSGIPDISSDESGGLKLQEKFRLDLDDEEAIHFFQDLINESVSALFPQMVETIHRWAQYWR
ncbi:hypothetical protein PR202_gb25465 [Eleusine coracana subsp. coracana]|uniref:phosphatidylinositol 3-kinase n=1 Tax=Eleusine coracana subsp. coracana TaxID=191504 RepID=A0AAV5FP18_ELECO|nr:hypothetical protein PR202_gb25465 [Eleusine coracana subsp. coracana]